MKSLKTLIALNRYYFIFFLVFFCIGLGFLLTQGVAGSFVGLNPYHRSTLDTFFIYATELGNGLFTVLVCLIFLLKRRWSRACQIIAAFLLSALVAQILKSAFSMPRPKQFFSPGQYPYFIEGVTHIGFSSFPSGHSTSVFALATLLAFFEKNNKGKLAYLLVAVAVGYSRIYLGQHFLSDVLMGSCIGVLAAIFVHWLFSEKLRSVPAFAQG
jgi:membrane-associated phospholipid phosphatase